MGLAYKLQWESLCTKHEFETQDHFDGIGTASVRRVMLKSTASGSRPPGQVGEKDSDKYGFLSPPNSKIG